MYSIFNPGCIRESLYDVCREGNINNVKSYIERGITDWNRGLNGACRKPHMDIVNLMIEN